MRGQRFALGCRKLCSVIPSNLFYIRVICYAPVLRYSVSISSGKDFCHQMFEDEDHDIDERRIWLIVRVRCGERVRQT
jgi:hypothetical protein